MRCATAGSLNRESREACFCQAQCCRIAGRVVERLVGRPLDSRTRGSVCASALHRQYNGLLLNRRQVNHGHAECSQHDQKEQRRNERYAGLTISNHRGSHGTLST